MTTTQRVRGLEFASANLAVQHVSAEGLGRAISVGGRYLAVDETEALRLEREGVPFAFLEIAERPARPEGVLVSVPVNGG